MESIKEIRDRNCFDCILILELNGLIQPEITDRRPQTIPDIRDNWTKAQVKKSAKDSTAALTKGQARRASNARRKNAQQYTGIFNEPIRALIAECSVEELRDIWIELKRVMREIDSEENHKLWNRLQRITHWIELHGKYRAYGKDSASRELTDNEFIQMILAERRGDI